jgi:hypothetical protein
MEVRKYRSEHWNRARTLFLLLVILTNTLSHAWMTLPLFAVGPWGKRILPIQRLKKERQQQKLLWIQQDGSSRLIQSSELPPHDQNQYRRIVAISDTHGKHRFLKIPPCDVLCHCGDLLQRYGYIGDLGGGLPALLDFSRWIQKKVPAKHVVMIGGNHDRLLEKLGDDQVRSLLKLQGGDTVVHYLNNEAVTVADLVIYGSPWSPSGVTGNKAFQRGSDASQEVELAQRLDHPPRVDVLLTHATCPRWEAAISKLGASFWAHGHWHDEQGRVKCHSNGCISVNVASNDMIYRPKNPPIVFDVPLPIVGTNA